MRGLFSANADAANAPSVTLAASRFADGIGIIDLLAETKLIASKSEARRMVQQGGILVNGEKVTDIARVVTSDDVRDGFVMLKKGKKNFLKVIAE